jgi:hypothetical protein
MPRAGERVPDRAGEGHPRFKGIMQFGLELESFHGRRTIRFGSSTRNPKLRSLNPRCRPGSLAVRSIGRSAGRGLRVTLRQTGLWARCARNPAGSHCEIPAGVVKDDRCVRRREILRLGAQNPGEKQAPTRLRIRCLPQEPLGQNASPWSDPAFNCAATNDTTTPAV